MERFVFVYISIYRVVFGGVGGVFIRFIMSGSFSVIVRFCWVVMIVVVIFCLEFFIFVFCRIVCGMIRVDWIVGFYWIRVCVFMFCFYWIVEFSWIEFVGSFGGGVFVVFRRVDFIG